VHARRASPAALAALAAALLLPVPRAAADALITKDGRFLEGPKIRRDGAVYRLQYRSGEVVVPAALVRDVLIEGVEAYEPKDDAEKEKLAKGLVPYDGKWVAKADRDAAVAKRVVEQRKRIQDVRAHREWRTRWTAKGRNFNFEYTIPPEACDSFRELMETYFNVFTKKWGITRPPKLGPLKVCFYHDYDTMVQVGGAGRGVLGYYQFRPIESLQLNFYYDRISPEDTVEVMFHETNHYLTHLIDLDFSYPHCINEAMAEYYGASHWDPVKKEISVGHALDGRLTEVLTDIQGGTWKKVEDYLTNKLGYDDYTWGWTFIHFMMETPKYSQKFQRFFIALAKAKDIERVDYGGGMRTVAGDELLRAFKKYMEVKDLAALEKEWHEHIKNGLKLESVRGYERAAFAADRSGTRPLRAARFFGLAAEKGSKNPALFKRYGDFLLGTGKPEEALVQYRRAIELDPLDAGLYATLAQALSIQGTEEAKAEGKLLADLAREINPDDAEVAELAMRALRAARGGGGDDPK